MSFWNQVNKAAKVGAKQTGKMIELGKLNMVLNAANVELQRLYEEIGECVYHEQIRDVSQSMKVQELIRRVTTQKAKIRSIQAEIHAVKRINACENCGHELKLGTKYCPYCSQPQSKHIKL